MSEHSTFPRLKTFFSLAILMTPLALLPACNTIEGAGQDIEAGGEAISDTARDTKEEITE